MAAAPGIVQLAADEGADLIVVGSHGRSGIVRLMLGSVASKVVAESPVPFWWFARRQRKRRRFWPAPSMVSTTASSD